MSDEQRPARRPRRRVQAKQVRPAARPPQAIEPQPARAEPEVLPSQPAEPDLPASVREAIGRADAGFVAFRAAAQRFPLERMNEQVNDGAWTFKQMLAHVAAWHDLTSDRLIKYVNTGRPAPLGRDTDAINAGVARQAIGKTAGEVLKDIEATYNRLRRQMQRLSDAQLLADEGWAAQVIAANTYGHYAEHWDEIYIPEPEPGAGGRR